MLTVPEDHYRLTVVRLAPVTDAAELAPAINGLLTALDKAHPLHFRFSGLSPAYDTLPVKDGQDDNLHRFLSSSELSYPFGKSADDPTHGVRFFNTPQEPAEFADLALSWFNVETEHPNFVAELRLGRDAAKPLEGARGAYLCLLFEALIRAFKPGFGFIELPRPIAPAAVRPTAPAFGWATFFSKRWPAVASVPAPGSLYPIQDLGTVFRATPDVEEELSSDVARAVDALEQAARPLLFPRPSVAPATPAAAGPAIAVPSYLKPKAGEPVPSREHQRPVAIPVPLEEATTEIIDPTRRPAPALPFSDQRTADPTPPNEPATPFERPPTKKK